MITESLNELEESRELLEIAGIEISDEEFLKEKLLIKEKRKVEKKKPISIMVHLGEISNSLEKNKSILDKLYDVSDKLNKYPELEFNKKYPITYNALLHIMHNRYDFLNSFDRVNFGYEYDKFLKEYELKSGFVKETYFNSTDLYLELYDDPKLNKRLEQDLISYGTKFEILENGLVRLSDGNSRYYCKLDNDIIKQYIENGVLI